MKSKYSILASVVALATIASASAVTEVYLTGSTAFRSSTHAAILAILSNETYAYTGGTASSAAMAIYKGQLGTEDVIIYTSWSGSAEGVRDVSNGNSQNFLASTVTTSAAGTSGLSNGTTAKTADIAMSDVFQSSTVYTSTTLTDYPVAVTPFRWLANKGSNSNITNVTPSLAQALYGAGKVPMSLFTGLAADQTKTIYATGRNPLSGTRITMTAEAGLGATAGVLQYELTVTSGAVSACVPFTAGTSGFAVGNNGESSGGTIATKMAATTASDVAIVSYAGLGDSNTAITNGARELQWNGVTYSTANVYDGKYSFWGYQHLMHKDTLSGVALDVATALKNELTTNPGSAGLKLSDMKVSRQFDGSQIGTDLTVTNKFGSN